MERDTRSELDRVWTALWNMIATHERDSQTLTRVATQMDTVLDHLRWDREQNAVNNRWKLAQIIFIGTPILADAAVHLLK